MRAHRFALGLILLVAAVIFVAPLIEGEVFVARDHFDYFQPLRWFTAEELKAGRLPLWNPYSAGGEPWLANPQTGVFYPPAWLFLILPFPAAYMAFLLVHLVILGCGAYLLFVRTASSGAAMAGAVAVMFAGPTLSLLDINNNLATLAWLPLVLWCAAERAWRRGAVALTLAFLGGEPFFAAIGALMFVIVAARSLEVVILAGLGAFGLSAIQLFPFLDAVRHSDRAAGLAPQAILRESMPLGDWLRIVIPGASSGQQFIPVIYTGMLVVALALVGLASIRKRHVLGWLALLAFAVVIGAGPSFLAQLPLTLFRYPARMVPLGALAIAGLAVAGWDRLRPANKRWVDLLLVLLVVADLLPRAQTLLVTAPFTPEVVPYRDHIGGSSKFLIAGDVQPGERTYWISGYLNLYDRRFSGSTAAPYENEQYRRFLGEALRSPLKMNVLAIGYILIRADTYAPPLLRPIASIEKVVVYRNPGAWPMARLVAGNKVFPARWEVDTKTARVTIDAPERGVVVLAQQLTGGWSVSVDGKPARAIADGGIFRAVQIEKGRHEIVWSYRSRALVIGAVVTLITALFIAVSLVVKGSQRAKNFSSGHSNLE